eukprot:2412267-Rhodomonas_salina.1
MRSSPLESLARGVPPVQSLTVESLLFARVLHLRLWPKWRSVCKTESLRPLVSATSRPGPGSYRAEAARNGSRNGHVGGGA